LMIPVGLDFVGDAAWITPAIRYRALESPGSGAEGGIPPQSFVVRILRRGKLERGGIRARAPKFADYLSVQLRCSSASFGKMPRIGPRLVATSALRWRLALAADVPTGSSRMA